MYIVNRDYMNYETFNIGGYRTRKEAAHAVALDVLSDSPHCNYTLHYLVIGYGPPKYVTEWSINHDAVTIAKITASVNRRLR